MNDPKKLVVQKQYALPQTEIIGATTSKALADANAGAEAWLLDKTDRVTSTPLAHRRYTLGCVACHLFGDSEGYVTGRGLSDCTGRSTESMYGILRLMQDENLLTVADDTVPTPYQQFQLASNDDALEFGRHLTPPDVCAFRAGKLIHEQGAPIAGATVPLSEMIAFQPPLNTIE